MALETLYVLDTNVLVHDPTAIFNFKHSTVGIPARVLEELDKFKSEPSGRGRSSREAIRLLDALREKGSLGQGVNLDNGGVIKVLFLCDKPPVMPFHINVEDNEILLTAMCARQEGYTVRFISKDLNARVKSDALGIPAQDYLREHVSEDDFYKGWVRIRVPAVQLKREFPQELDLLREQQDLLPNQYVLVESQHNPFQYQIFRYLGGSQFRPVHEPHMAWPLTARNPQQAMALDALLDDTIQLVTLYGPAGTGKTFLALLAGLHKVLIEDHYERLLVSRPVVPLGRDIGYLPGTIEEKLRSWMLPIYDNIDFISHSVQFGQHTHRVEQERGISREMPPQVREFHGKKKKQSQGTPPKREAGGLLPMDELVRQNKLSLEAITYMRGRSIPYQYIFIDEVQNLTPHEVKTLVSRVGEGSKIILSGDPYQIDSPYLDFSSNGLMYATERLKGQKLVAAVYLEKSERSELSTVASELL